MKIKKLTGDLSSNSCLLSRDYFNKLGIRVDKLYKVNFGQLSQNLIIIPLD